MEQEMKQVCLTTKISVQFTTKEFATIPKDREDNIEDIRDFFTSDMISLLQENIQNIEVTGITVDPVVEVIE